MDARRKVRALGWLLTALSLWVISFPVSWLLVNGAHIVFTGARNAPTSFWEVAVLSYLYAGVLPLAVALGVLWYLGQLERQPFRRAAIITSLLLGGWFGFYAIGFLDPAIQTVLVAWAAFGALVPRPPRGLTDVGPASWAR